MYNYERNGMRVYAKNTMFNIVVNNPQDYFQYANIERLEELLRYDLGAIYFCTSLETSTHGTPHRHIFVIFRISHRFDRLKKKLPYAHIERCNGTAIQNRNYVLKLGKWENNKEKQESKVDGSVYEFNLPLKSIRYSFYELKDFGILLPCWEEEHREWEKAKYIYK